MAPSPHLNIITGETGAGKSIMLGAVGLLLGNRADTKALFTEDQKCVVEGVFDVKGYQLEGVFTAADLDFEPECIIRREISPSGKSRAFVNDTPVTLDILKRIGIRLMDIHSQHESLELANNGYQQDILDLFAGHDDLKTNYQQDYQHYKTCEKQYQTLQSKAHENAQEADYKQFLYNELEAAKLEADELEALEEELEILENAEAIKTNLAQLFQLIDESEFSLTNQIKTSLPLLGAIKKYSKSLDGLYERLNSTSIELQDISSEINREQEAVELDPERLQVVKERIDLLFRLQQKHQVNTVNELISIRDRLSEELTAVQNIDEEIQAAEKRFQDAEKSMTSAATQLSASRKKHAEPFGEAIRNLVHKLGIENAVVLLKVAPAKPGSDGADLIEMLFSANKGVQPREVKHVASGGEFSRLIFAVKYLLADKTALPTIIFDEIDTGVSGEVAIQMVSMMKTMAQNHQVISISHLPQFAAGGDAHYFVYKDHSEAKSVSRIKKLQNDERVMAIARMIGGDQPGNSALASAKELLGEK